MTGIAVAADGPNADNQPRVPAGRAPNGPEGDLPPADLLWKSLTESIDCFVTVLGPDLRIRYLNHVDVGYDAVRAVLGREVTEFVVPESRDMVRSVLREVLSTGRGGAYDVDGMSPTGERATYSVRVSSVEEDGRPTALVLTAVDARKLHETERALRSERQALRQLIRTQERERQMISYEIHDGLAQYLAGATMRLEAFGHAIGSPDSPDGRAALAIFEEGLRLARAAAAESRRLVNGLRPPMLDEFGVIVAVESLVADAKPDIPTIEYLHPPSLPRLDAGVETAIFRIVQESLSNSRKHAKARVATVVLERRGESDIAAIVTDDGVGFDANHVPDGCFGLEGIRQRARLFGREATIASNPGGGTRIEVVLPTFPALENPA